MVTAESDYTERRSRIPGAVVWSRHIREDGAGRILPDGCMDVIHCAGELLVAGPDTTAHLAWSPAGRRFTAIRFAPGTAPGILGVPADALRDQRVPLEAFWPLRRVRRLTGMLDEAPDRAAVLEAALIGEVRPPEPWVGAAVARLRTGASVAAVATEVGLSERQLHRRCLFHFGYGLKTLFRILRVNDALDLARGGMAFGEVATVAGYADQAHLSREVKALAGAPLTAVLGLTASAG
ncbi:helix-turn-helix transcriptional regulator [Dactylosporangium fulvum]|uniref:Helix-turn-helix domain-containing protein n=1 Tax=Dactylosporangium fulvum TaxID=53359 RepID=A0ABY5VWX1_9ACTN|nr:helix-turn-helix domain-containing protein [Dactylosporangium fulvum]UWP82283.1 helix-turn-helix domain-containing protein [Dactylosporangium fulvum]